MNFFFVLLILLPTFSFADEGDLPVPVEERIRLRVDISVEKCTLIPHECVSDAEVGPAKVLVLKGTSKYSDGWLTLSETLYGKEYNSTIHMMKFSFDDVFWYSITVVLAYELDGNSKVVQFSSTFSGPNDLDSITLQGPSFGTPELNYSPIVMFGPSRLEVKNEF